MPIPPHPQNGTSGETRTRSAWILSPVCMPNSTTLACSSWCPPQDSNLEYADSRSAAYAYSARRANWCSGLELADFRSRQNLHSRHPWRSTSDVQAFNLALYLLSYRCINLSCRGATAAARSQALRANWHPLRDSNPRHRAENPVSLATRRKGRYVTAGRDRSSKMVPSGRFELP